MKRILFSAATVLLVAAGAFATATSYAPNTYFYIPDAGGCEPIVVQYDCVINPLGGCVEPTVPALNKQLFVEDLEQEPCTVKLLRP